MCTGLEIAALASAAAGTAGTFMQANAADEAADKQQNILRAADEENQRLNKAGEDATQKFAEQTFDPNARAQGYEQAATDREQSLAQALTSAKPGGDPTIGGNVSSDYLSASTTSQQGAAGEAAKRAKLLARTGAGGLLGGRDAMRAGQLSSDMAGLSSSGDRNNRYAKTAAGNVRSDSLAGSLLSAAGSAGMGYAGSQMGAGAGAAGVKTIKGVPGYPGAGY